MAILINRKYSSRIECLFYILQTTYQNFGNKKFIISDVKYNPHADSNVFDYCKLLKSYLGRDFCPFLENPLNTSKCYATQSTESDSTKSKAASATVRAFEALGLVRAVDNKFQITDSGIKLCSLTFESLEWFELVQNAVLSYGPMNAFLLKAFEKGPEFNSSSLYISYPITDDPIDLSIGSTKDSNTRTVSMLVSWALTAGLIEPTNLRNTNNVLPQLFYRELINHKSLRVRRFALTQAALTHISCGKLVENPLSYNALNKNVGSLRERNSEEIRELTLRYNHIVLNRRFALIYLLNNAYNSSTEVSLQSIHNVLLKYSNEFFLPNSNTLDIIQTEINICPLAGLMINVSPSSIKVLNPINLDILSAEAPADIIKICKEMIVKL